MHNEPRMTDDTGVSAEAQADALQRAAPIIPVVVTHEGGSYITRFQECIEKTCARKHV